MPEGSADAIDAGARLGRNFTPERADSSVNVFEAVVDTTGAALAWGPYTLALSGVPALAAFRRVGFSHRALAK